MEPDSAQQAPRPVSTRDHLANERTYLSWVRSGLGMAAFGVAVARLFSDGGRRADLAGAMLMLLGIAMLLYGTNRYYLVRRALNLGLVAERRIGVVPMALAVATIIGAMLLIMR